MSNHNNVVQNENIDVLYPATCVEWNPLSKFEHLLVCGTYQLIAENERIGFLSLFQTKVDQDEGGEEAKICQQLDVGSGVLDAKWSPNPLREKPAIATVDAKCNLDIYEVADDRLTRILRTTVGPDTSLALSLDWSSTRDKCADPYIATSDSDGRLSLFQLKSEQLQAVVDWKAHDFEAWTVAFDYWNPNVVYSGGDDSRFKGWDVRQKPDSPTFNSRQHTMGVTSIQSNCWKEHLLASGSYDESMVLWDVRQMRSHLSTVGLEGGIWRIKFDPEEGRFALAACMHAGAAVVDCERTEAPVRVARYEEHGSMVYGVDWKRHTDCRKDLTVASCSFYDKAMHLWTFRSENTKGSEQINRGLDALKISNEVK